jgi:RNA polymerase sigma-70 factor (ECF subfamily)
MSQPDRKALFADVLKRNERRIVAIARSYATVSDTPDLVQEILLQLWRALADFRGQASIDTWTFRIALNVALTWKRTIQRRQQSLPARVIDPDLLSADPSDGDEPARALREFLPTLGEIDRAVLLLYLDNLSHQQMAEILGISENAISVRLHRIRLRFESHHGKG